MVYVWYVLCCRFLRYYIHVMIMFLSISVINTCHENKTWQKFKIPFNVLYYRLSEIRIYWWTVSFPLHFAMHIFKMKWLKTLFSKNYSSMSGLNCKSWSFINTHLQHLMLHFILSKIPSNNPQIIKIWVNISVVN